MVVWSVNSKSESVIEKNRNHATARELDPTTNIEKTLIKRLYKFVNWLTKTAEVILVPQKRVMLGYCSKPFCKLEASESEEILKEARDAKTYHASWWNRTKRKQWKLGSQWVTATEAVQRKKATKCQLLQ